MKKLLFVAFSFIIILSTVLLVIDSNSYNNKGQNDSEDIPNTGGSQQHQIELKGYYYFGFLDEREKMSNDAEDIYFYHMDNHFKSYYEDFFEMTQSDDVNEQSYNDYFEEINGLKLITIHDNAANGIENGDYISVEANGPIQESYPMQIGKIEKIDILYPR
ncbi:DUF3221 domain-containing protein [Oceanobacillus manasiensis]|uniref:DUF3221 domain-containing protein n=1 Tax=Oceanobacillus manasiensis TaxID=586413 RepID=UPI0005A9D38B|nr:DUF3221 domain-containing protein [Oceanobacillus manasiensis]